LIVIGSSTVFNDVIALSVSSLFLSYLICSCLLLYRRCTGAILPASAVETTTPTGDPSSVVLNTVDDTGAVVLVWGPFHVPGIWGVLVNIFAIIYLVIGIFFSLWPPTREVTGSTMNYGVVGTGGVIILSTAYYVCYARKIYTGPVVEINGD
jgi:choline transport protein